MKTNIKQLYKILLSACMFLTACQKEASVKNTSTENKVTANSSDNLLAKFCRLHTWHGLDDGYLRTLHYNDKGLMDSWHETSPLYDEDIFITIEYDHFNRVTTVTYSDHGSLLYTIHPVYKGIRITEELWYDGNSQTLVDHLVNTYNAFGRIVKRESVLQFYYVAFKYDILGNNTLEVIKDAVTGETYDSTIQVFKKPVIEPMTAAPGMPYPIPFANYIISPLKYSDLIEYDPDENGNLVKTYDQDNSKSILKANSFHFAAYYDTYDDVSGLENRQVWHYENCDCDNNDDATANQPVQHLSLNKNTIPIIYQTLPQMRARIMQLRKLKK